MGLKLESRTLEREKRYMGLNISKNRDGTNQGYITVATGYYDEFDAVRLWVTEKEDIIHLSNDMLGIMFNLKHTDLGLPEEQATLFNFMDTAIYAIISGQIKMKYKLTVTVKNEVGPVENYIISVKKGNVLLTTNFSSESTSVLQGDVVIGAVIEVSKPGYVTASKPYTALTGDRVWNPVLVPVEPPAEPPATEPTP